VEALTLPHDEHVFPPLAMLVPHLGQLLSWLLIGTMVSCILAGVRRAVGLDTECKIMCPSQGSQKCGRFEAGVVGYLKHNGSNATDTGEGANATLEQSDDGKRTLPDLVNSISERFAS
jgi:hypothetical protein